MYNFWYYLQILSSLGLAIGIWVFASGNNEYDIILGNYAVSSAAILLTSSIVSFILCASGIIGGIFMWRVFLVIVSCHYVVLAIVVLLHD